MSEPAVYIFSFESTHAAMASNKTLSHTGRSFAMIPTPREISAGCGMSLRFEAFSEEEACGVAGNLLEAQGLAALYVMDGKDAYSLIKRL